MPGFAVAAGLRRSRLCAATGLKKSKPKSVVRPRIMPAINHAWPHGDDGAGPAL